ncbi:MAG: alpha/beta fold hydrolase [Clostridia bacterium]|nr:alpha/beta fold hydrolase [Clostridia bacterium]
MNKRPERDFTVSVCQPFFLEGTVRRGKTHGVLLMHGFTGTIAHMRMVGEALNRQGFTVMGINLPGHATDMDDMARKSWQDWLNAAKDAFLTLKEKCDCVSVAGLSMGGCLSLIIGEQMQPTAIAPISAPMGTQLPLWLASLTRPVLPTIWWKTRDGDFCPVVNEYDYGYPGFRNSCTRHLARLIKLARRDLHAVTCPVLVVQSHGDETIIPQSADIILRGVSSVRKGVLWLDDAPHVCTITQEAERIAAAIGDHFRWAEDNE